MTPETLDLKCLTLQSTW